MKSEVWEEKLAKLQERLSAAVVAEAHRLVNSEH